MFKNLDTVSKLGILLCAGLLGFGFYTNDKETKAQAEAMEKARLEEEIAELEAANQPEGESGMVKEANAELVNVEPVVEATTYTVENDQAIYTYSSTGGSLIRVEFKGQQQVVDREAQVQFNADGLYGIGSIFSSPSSPVTTQFVGQLGANDVMSFEGQLSPQVTIKKVFVPVDEEDGEGNGFRTKATYVFQNTTNQPVSVKDLYLHMGTASPLHAKELPQAAGFFWYDNGFKFKDRNAFNGGLFSSEKKRISKDPNSLRYFGVANQFFTSTAVVNWDEPSELRASARKVDMAQDAEGEKVKTVNLVDLSAQIPAFTLPANGSHTVAFDLYTGPKEAKFLKEVDPKLKKVMNYGFFGILSPLLNWILNGIEGIWENVVASSYAWGLAIISLTLVVRLSMWPLHKASMTSMKRMSKLSPLMQKIRDKYGDDQQKVQVETMGLYKKYGINPLSGCLPMLIQMPIFFGFFAMLRSASELRGQKFLFWVEDLSLPDTVATIPLLGGIDVNPLPILMAITSFIQMSIMPQQQGPQNPNMPDMRKIMKFMPLMFLFFCYDYASALALYWTTTNLFSIFQTWYIQRLPEPELKEVAADQENKKPGFFDKMKEQMEEARKLQEQENRKKRGLKDAKPKKRSPKTGGR